MVGFHKGGSLGFFLCCWCLAGFLPSSIPLFSDPANRKSDELIRVIFLGDSITAGYGLEAEEAYPALLQKKADEAFPGRIRMVNAGLSGDTTAGGLRRLDWVMGEGADVLLVALGGNDGLRGLDPGLTEGNLASIISRARELQPDVLILLAGMQMPDSMGRTYARSFAEVFPAVAEREGVELIPFLLEGVAGKPEKNLPDRIHPNAKGQQRIAATVWEALRHLLEKNFRIIKCAVP